MIKNKNILHGINRSEVPHFKSGPPVIQGSQVPPFSLSILHINLWNSPNGEIDEGTFEFYQPYKQTKNKMQLTGKIPSNK